MNQPTEEIAEEIHTPAPTPKKVITDATKISELTVGELKAIMWDLLDKAIFMIEQQLPDPDEGKELKPEVAEVLRRYQQTPPKTRPMSEVMKELGLAGDE